jgi:hypothetical protein
MSKKQINRWSLARVLAIECILMHLLANFGRSVGSTHWQVTESGRIEINEDSFFSLLRPYDLATFLKQDERLKRLAALKELLESKDVSNKRLSNKGIDLCLLFFLYDSFIRILTLKTTQIDRIGLYIFIYIYIKDSQTVSYYQEHFYKADADCLKAGQPLTKFPFYETYFITWDKSDDVELSKQLADLKQSTDTNSYKKPYCDKELPFRMGNFDHLEVISKDLYSFTLL